MNSNLESCHAMYEQTLIRIEKLIDGLSKEQRNEVLVHFLAQEMLIRDPLKDVGGGLLPAINYLARSIGVLTIGMMIGVKHEEELSKEGKPRCDL